MACTHGKNHFGGKIMFTSIHSNWQKQKNYPDYYFQIKNRPYANPIFITVDRRCLKYIKSHRGICLYCNHNQLISAYDFSFCYNRDVWILYSIRNYFPISMQLGQIIQLSAASKVLVIPLIIKFYRRFA